MSSVNSIREGDRVAINLTAWIMHQKKLATRDLKGEIKRVTSRAVLLEGTYRLEAASSCRRCGRRITHPGSLLIGVGPDCAEYLGLDRKEIERLTEEEIAEVREAFEGRHKLELWIPKSHITELEVLGHAGKVPLPASGAGTAGKNERGATPPRPAPEGGRSASRDSIRATVQGGRIFCRGPFHVKDLLKSITGARWHPEAKAWTYPATPTAARALASLKGLEPSAEVEELIAAGERVGKLQDLKSRDDLPDIETVTTEAWLHQRQAFAFAKDLPAAVFNMHMGTGKTLVNLGLIAYKGARRTVVLAPKRVIPVWPVEFARHVGLSGWRILTLENGSTEKRAAEIDRAKDLAAAKGERLVVVVNYEAAWRGELKSALERLEPDGVVFDEVHRIKSAGGKASMFASRLAALPSVKFRYGLSGTLMPHGPLDVYGVFRAIDPGVFGTSFARFKKRYTEPDFFGGVKHYKNLDELNEKMGPLVYQAEKGVLDLPPLMHQEVHVELSPKARQLYKSLERDLYAAWERGEIDVNNALTKLLRLQQITSGWIQPNESEELQRVDDSKERALESLLEDLPKDEPVVVFSIYRADLEVIAKVAEKLGRRYAELSGSRSELETWQRGEAEILGVNIRAGGLGVNLSRARYAVYYSQTFSLGDYEQSLDRLHRPGQERSVVYYHLVSRATVDTRIYRALRDKRKVVDTVLATREEPDPGAEDPRLEQLPF